MEIISKYRGALMGVAILWVLCFHLFSNINVSIIPVVSGIGYCGVDIFLFLSGFGLCYGYQKYSSVWQFYLRRFSRIYPTYLLIIILSVLFSGSVSVFQIVTRSFGIGWFVPHYGLTYFDWYVPTLFVFYLIFPLAYKFITKTGITAVGVLILATIPAILQLYGINIHVNPITISRIPIFIIGIFMGNWYIKKKVIKKSILSIWSIIAVSGCIIMVWVVKVLPSDYLWVSMIYWLPFIFIVPGLCTLTSRFLDRASIRIVKILNFLGTISLEIYLCHMLVLKEYAAFVNRMPHGVGIKWIFGILFIIGAIVCGYIINITISYIKSIPQLNKPWLKF